MAKRTVWILCLLMVAASVAAAYVRPTTRLADRGPKIDLETLIPERFGDWTIDRSIVPIMANEQQLATLNKIYTQTLSRTYLNTQGYRIMLSIAYGSDQSDGLQVHRPEVCYAAQGFEILSQRTDQLRMDGEVLPVKRVLSRQRSRIEPITYWVMVGDHPAGSRLDQKLAQISYGLTGKIPDGMLVRVSSIDTDEKGASVQQDEFARQLLIALPLNSRTRFAGTTR